MGFGLGLRIGGEVRVECGVMVRVLPGSHRHAPSAHTPCPLQPAGQPRASHATPAYGARQRHAPPWLGLGVGLGLGLG